VSGVQLGDVLKILFPYHTPEGHEQQGPRPAVVVGVPDTLGEPRFPTLVVIPLTSQLEDWTTKAPDLYPLLETGAGGLTLPSAALIDQVRSVGVSRIIGRYGTLTAEQLRPIKAALTRMLELTL